MSYRSRIIDIYQWSSLLFHIVDLFIDEHFGLSEQERRQHWNEKKSSNHTFFMLDDSFSRALKWRESECRHDDLVKGVLRDIIYSTYVKRASKDDDILDISEIKVPKDALDDLFVVIDPIQILIDELVSDVVGDNPWWIWEIEYVPKGSVLIRSSGDFRIKTFNDKVASGEWTLP